LQAEPEREAYAWDQRFSVHHFAGPKTAGRDAALVIAKLPKAEHDADEWQAGMQALLLVRTDRREAGAAKA
jgi:hypothetical protein